MRTADQKNLSLAKESDATAEIEWNASLTSALTHRAYHEMADRPVVESDALTQLENNLQLLEDLQGRLSFLMREVRYLLKA